MTTFVTYQLTIASMFSQSVFIDEYAWALTLGLFLLISMLIHRLNIRKWYSSSFYFCLSYLNFFSVSFSSPISSCIVIWNLFFSFIIECYLLNDMGKNSNNKWLFGDLCLRMPCQRWMALMMIRCELSGPSIFDVCTQKA